MMISRRLRPGRSVDLVILDDILPADFSPFRSVEYRHYLETFNSALLTFEGWGAFVGRLSFDEVLRRSSLPESVKGQVQPFAGNTIRHAALGYVSFVMNAVRALPWLTANRVPFVLQLYPGGGFQIDHADGDAKLRTILASPLCRRVIATQTITHDYLRSTFDYPDHQITSIFGGVLETRNGFEFERDKPRFPGDKDSIDVCFVAHKYTADLTSKGYGAFVAIAAELAGRGPANVRFHVVGGFGPDDVALDPPLRSRFTFHGVQTQAFLRDWFPGMDLIVSINRPFGNRPGSFDGFPTGSCVEAGLLGVLNCINDPLELNTEFVPGQDFVLLDDDVAAATRTILGLVEDPERMYQLANQCWIAYRRVFDTDRQLAARTELLVSELHSVREPASVRA